MKAAHTILIAIATLASSANAATYFNLGSSDITFDLPTNNYNAGGLTNNGVSALEWTLGFTITNDTSETMRDVRFIYTGLLAAYGSYSSGDAVRTSTLEWNSASQTYLGSNPQVTSNYDSNALDLSMSINSADVVYAGMALSETDVNPTLWAAGTSDFILPSTPAAWGLGESDYNNVTLQQNTTYPYFVLGDIAPGASASVPAHALVVEIPDEFDGTDRMGHAIYGRVVALPEPSSALLLGLGWWGLLAKRRR